MLYPVESFLADAAAIAQRVRTGEKWFAATAAHFESRYGDEVVIRVAIFVAVDHFKATFAKRLVRERLAMAGPDGLHLVTPFLAFILAGLKLVKDSGNTTELQHPFIRLDRTFRYDPLVDAYRAARADLSIRKNGH